MYTDKLRVSDYNENTRYLSINASWITIKMDNKVIFKREPEMATWYDEYHQKIVDAMRVLELLILEAPKEND